MRLITQRENADCGVACLAMILDYYGSKVHYAKVYEATDTDKNGTNMRSIAESAEIFGLNVEAFTGTAEDFRESVQKKEIHFPIIARIINSAGMSHFVVVMSAGRNKVSVYDPDVDTGKKKYSWEFFSKVFLGEIMTFEKKRNFPEIKRISESNAQIGKASTEYSEFRRFLGNFAVKPAHYSDKPISFISD